LAFLPFY